jgi:hypothetical protein
VTDGRRPKKNGFLVGSVWQDEQLREAGNRINELVNENTELKVIKAKLEGDLNSCKEKTKETWYFVVPANIFITLGVGLLVAEYKNITSGAFWFGLIFTLFSILLYIIAYRISYYKQKQ